MSEGEREQDEADSCLPSFFYFRNKWELHSQNATKAGANIAESPIRSLSTITFRNPSIQVDGLVPYLDTSLEVYWNYAVPYREKRDAALFWGK